MQLMKIIEGRLRRACGGGLHHHYDNATAKLHMEVRWKLIDMEAAFFGDKMRYRFLLKRGCYGRG